MRLELDISVEFFVDQLAQEVALGGLTVVDTIERLLVEQLEDSASAALAPCLVKAPTCVVHPHYFANRFESLYGLRSNGYSTWYPEVRFSTTKEAGVVVGGVDVTGIEVGSISYGHGVERSYNYTRKELKTQVNHFVRLNRVEIAPDVFSQVVELVQQSDAITQPYIANLTAGWHNFVDDRIEGFRVVAFDHVVTGERAFCSCHRTAHQSMLEDAREVAPSYAPFSWPHRVIALLESSCYVQDICHLCVGTKHGMGVPEEWYGREIQDHFEPYVDLLVRRDGMDSRTAAAEARRQLSISRWVREEELYQLTKRLFSSHTIRREASPDWLGQLRLDVYLPDLGLAIEHQGEQHYRPVGAFGGESAFAKIRERDQRKRKLCGDNGVSVVDVRFDEPLSLGSLRHRLRRWIT